MTETQERLKKACQALAIISASQASKPPMIAAGNIVLDPGLSPEGHLNCIKLARQTLGEVIRRSAVGNDGVIDYAKL